MPYPDQAGTASYTYDIMGRMATEQRAIAGVSKAVSYEYNLDGSLKVLHYPSGAAVTYTPDSAGRVLSAVDAGSNINYVTSATYGPDGSLTGFVSGNTGAFAGITNAFSYNNRLQPVSMSASSPSQTVFSIGYDFHVGNGDNGNVFAIANNRDSTRNQTFTYDALNRLASAQNAGTDCSVTVGGKTKFWGNAYGYDAWGNLLSKTVTKCGGESLSVTAGGDNRLQGGYTYDAAGNMMHDATSGNNYTYDQENRLSGAAGYTYTYDADGNRVRKSNGSAGTLYWYMAPGVVAESDLTGATQSEYVFFDGKRVARRDGTNGAGGVFYYFSDRLKTASVITDSAGNIKAESDYYPWGGEIQFVNNDSNHYKFTGKERDDGTGLDFFGARYYGSVMGRFTSVDPVTVTPGRVIDPQQLNLYAYVRNNPLVFIDPTGMIIDTSLLNEKDLEKWKKIAELANAKDKNGNVNPKLHEVYGKLDSDKRTFFIENTKLGASTSGKFEITKFNGANDFSEAVIHLDFKKIESINTVTKADLVEGFNKFEGLLDGGTKIQRLAEVFGHEGGHGVYALSNIAESVQLQKLLNSNEAAREALPLKHRYPLPPDLQQKIADAERGLIPTERYAQQVEKIINGELRASSQKKN